MSFIAGFIVGIVVGAVGLVALASWSAGGRGRWGG